MSRPLPPPYPPMLLGHTPTVPTGSIMDPAIREAQARINAASRPNPQPFFDINNPNSVLGQAADVGHELIKNLLGAQPFGPESPDAYKTVDVGQGNLLQQLHGRFQTMEPKQSIAMPVGGELGPPGAPAPPPIMRTAEEEASLLRSFGRMQQHMRPEVVDTLGNRIKANIADAFKNLPPPEEWEAAARAGVAKRGWYKNSGAAIRATFGDDTPIFTGILAATSPRQSVTENFKMASRVFGEWMAAGRPEDEEGIMKVLEKVPGATMPSRVPNQIKAIQGKPLVDFTDPTSGGGYKVESFRRNLMGEMDYATNDTWMAKFIGQLGDYFGSKANYLATDARTRQVAKRMGWSTAEVQETIWSWLKTLVEQTPSSSTLQEGLKGVTHEQIGQDVDFAKLLRDPEIARELERFGIRAPADIGAPAAVGPQGSRTAPAQAVVPGSEAPDPRILERVARRLQRQGIKPIGAAARP